MDPWSPSVDYPGLTLARLLIAADLVRGVRNEAVDDHRPEKFETNWSLGVRQYERTEGILTWASQQPQYAWLTVLAGESGGASQYVFAIGGHSVRFCRGDEEEIAKRYQSPCFPEIAQQQLHGLDPGADLWLRLVIENFPDGKVDKIWLMEIDGVTGDPIRSFLVPELAQSTVVAEFVAPPEPPVQIPPVTAEAVDDAADAEKDQNKTGSADE